MTASYADFLRAKNPPTRPAGFEAGNLNQHLFPFQAHVVRWALKLGRAAIFASTGLGKTIMQCEWAHQVAQHTGGRVLIVAPLAVAQQTVREAAKFGIVVHYAKDAADVPVGARIVITNYERFDRFNVSTYVGVVLDESGILKSYSGKVKNDLVKQCAVVNYRLACTATPAPNDHMELGNHAEFLGVMTSHEMLTRWFINDTMNFGKYRLKGHAVRPFWDWVASWAVCISLPSDIGYSDDGYVLPDLRMENHVIEVNTAEGASDGMLFREVEMSATSLHKEKRLTTDARAAEVARLVAAEPDEQWLAWCDTDYEADALKLSMPHAVEVRGSHSAERKEQAAIDFVDGKIQLLISKPGIFGYGLNFQGCSRTAFIGANFSYEKFYQAVRRFWRFGQKRPVDVHVVMASTELGIWKILSDKRESHDEMREQMSAAMQRAQSKSERLDVYAPTAQISLPAWMKGSV